MSNKRQKGLDAVRASLETIFSPEGLKNIQRLRDGTLTELPEDSLATPAPSSLKIPTTVPSTGTTTATVEGTMTAATTGTVEAPPTAKTAIAPPPETVTARPEQAPQRIGITKFLPHMPSAALGVAETAPERIVWSKPSATADESTTAKATATTTEVSTTGTTTVTTKVPVAGTQAWPNGDPAPETDAPQSPADDRPTPARPKKTPSANCRTTVEPKAVAATDQTPAPRTPRAAAKTPEALSSAGAVVAASAKGVSEEKGRASVTDTTTTPLTTTTTVPVTETMTATVTDTLEGAVDPVSAEAAGALPAQTPAKRPGPRDAKRGGLSANQARVLDYLLAHNPCRRTYAAIADSVGLPPFSVRDTVYRFRDRGWLTTSRWRDGVENGSLIRLRPERIPAVCLGTSQPEATTIATTTVPLTGTVTGATTRPGAPATRQGRAGQSLPRPKRRKAARRPRRSGEN